MRLLSPWPSSSPLLPMSPAHPSCTPSPSSSCRLSGLHDVAYQELGFNTCLISHWGELHNMGRDWGCHFCPILRLQNCFWLWHRIQYDLHPSLFQMTREIRPLPIIVDLAATKHLQCPHHSPNKTQDSERRSGKKQYGTACDAALQVLDCEPDNYNAYVPACILSLTTTPSIDWQRLILVMSSLVLPILSWKSMKRASK